FPGNPDQRGPGDRQSARRAGSPHGARRAPLIRQLLPPALGARTKSPLHLTAPQKRFGPYRADEQSARIPSTPSASTTPTRETVTATLMTAAARQNISPAVSGVLLTTCPRPGRGRAARRAPGCARPGRDPS